MGGIVSVPSHVVAEFIVSGSAMDWTVTATFWCGSRSTRKMQSITERLLHEELPTAFQQGPEVCSGCTKQYRQGVVGG